MDYFSLVLVSFIAFLFCIHHYLAGKSRHNLPPCPISPLPVVGHIFALASDQRSKFKKWREQCGDIFCLYMGSKDLVIINGYELFQETFVKRADDFSDRPLTILDTFTGSQGKGVVTSTGSVWKEHRSVALHILRTFGMGKNILATRAQEEISHYVEHLSQFNGRNVDLRIMTHVSLSNIICSILLGQRFEYTDIEFITIMKYLDRVVRRFPSMGLVNFFPMLRYVPGDFFGIKKSERDMAEIFKMFGVFIEKYRESHSEDNLITEYLKEQKKKLQNGEKTTMDDANLKKVMFDLFIAATETTSTTIYWFVLYMLHYPDVQRKIFEEINEHVGYERLPTLQDKANLTYLRATIMETQRLASVAASAFAHTCPRDVTVRGYTIPKGTYITPNLDSVLHDEKIWGSDVMRFRPDRFLDQDGKVKTPEEFIPFFLGKRACLGESLANTELFLYLANMLQTFEFQPIDQNHPSPIKHTYGLTVAPEPYEVKIVTRKH